MKVVRKSHERGFVNMGWLKSYHSFSFGEYHDPKWMGFKKLRVINDDFIAAYNGFGMHPHRDMEIITFMREGELTHQDSMGNKEVIRTGDIQVMTAGTGVLHSEENQSSTNTQLLQIWVLPDRLGHKPRYEQKNFLDELKCTGLKPLAGTKDEMPIKLNANVNLYHGRLQNQDLENLPINFYLHVYEGELELSSGEKLVAGDALMTDAGSEIKLHSLSAAFLLFEF